MAISRSQPIAAFQRGLGAACVGAFVLLFALAGSASAEPSVTVLNQQRAANGIPQVTDVPSYASSWCPNENAGSDSGALEGNTAASTNWTAQSTPFAGAPLHALSVYNPTFSAAGVSTAGNTTCVGMGWGPGDPPPPGPSGPTFYAFVGPQGPGAVASSGTVADETPYNPLESVGFTVGERTGPIIMLWGWVPESNEASAPPATPISWALTAADGTVVPDVRIASTKTLKEGGFATPPIPMGGAAMASSNPLAPNTTYRGEVIWQGAGGSQATQAFSFTTDASVSTTGVRNPRLRVQLRLRGRLISGFARFARGDAGALTVVAKCRPGRIVRRLQVSQRRPQNGVARIRGRVPASCARVTVLAAIAPNGEFRTGKARPRHFRLKTK